MACRPLASQARDWALRSASPMAAREHFMPPSLLESQLDTLEPLQSDEDGMDLDIALPVDELVAQVLLRLELS